MRVDNKIIAYSQLLRVVRAFSELPQLRVAGLELSQSCYIPELPGKVVIGQNAESAHLYFILCYHLVKYADMQLKVACSLFYSYGFDYTQ